MIFSSCNLELNRDIMSFGNIGNKIFLLALIHSTIGLSVEYKVLEGNATVANNEELLAPDGLKPCTCGVFMTGQIKPRKQPTGYALVMSESEDHFQCNAIGRKQCQTKCVEQMVKHLSGNAASACSLLDRNVYKERAYLFVKNCDDEWHNTRLSSGRELCCKDGKPYKCPL